MIAPHDDIFVPAVAPEARAARIAHPQVRLRVFRVGAFGSGQRAVIVDVIVPATDRQHAFLHQGLLEPAVEPRRGRRFREDTAAWDDSVFLPVLGQGDVDEGHVHVNMLVARVAGAVPQALRRGLEPIDLRLLEPVVAAELALVRAVAVGVEEVERQGRVGGCAPGSVGEDLDVVVPHSFNGGRSGKGEGVWQVLGQFHQSLTTQGAFVVVVPEDGCKRDGAFDEHLGELEHGGLGVGRCLAVDLVAGEDDEVGLFAVEDGTEEFEGADVGIASPAIVAGGFRVAADAEAGGEMEVCNLHDLEPAVFADSWDRPLDGDGGPAANGQAGFLIIAWIGKKNRLVKDLPSRSRLDSVSAEQDIDRGDCFGRIGCMALCTALDPDASRARFPSVCTTAFLRRGRIEATNFHVENHAVRLDQLGLSLALNVNVGMVEPAFVQVQVLLDAVPFGRIELAARKKIQA